ncbi:MULTISPECIES: ribokinase [Cyanophyceae]|uniref:ribokinase n=1 Tax=Cyanophyceae TaxID=3028117 RepID=UPI0016831506|nr:MULTISPECIES: ribokinase [Cyanophyceae]MBD1915024.1 ribokinase [Phormidium sp. FACHB-77]MBD2029333.1 ribokinase [Phormidium sp. FACHB-322]MBD2053192.1 ribokinase [Leptolyngbya sp. FACHB-60]
MTPNPPPKTIHVFGSLNMDLVCRTPHLPQPGETILGTQFETLPGGKGANQAVAAARLGAATTMVGRVGADDFGRQLIEGLQGAGVDASGVVVDGEVATGVAAIAVDSAGQNTIVVVPGANGQISDSDVDRLTTRLRPGDLVLLQFEVPLPLVIIAAKTAKAQGATVIADPAPARTDLPPEFLRTVDIFTPNQVEASQLTGLAVTDIATATAAAQQLVQRGVAIAIVKLGAQGVVVAENHRTFHQPALAVKAVDTVAAGDAFNGGLAVALAEAMDLEEAVQFANAVAAAAVMVPGAQPSMPERSQVAALRLGLKH